MAKIKKHRLMCKAEDIRGSHHPVPIRPWPWHLRAAVPLTALHFVLTVLLRDLRNFTCSLSVDLSISWGGGTARDPTWPTASNDWPIQVTQLLAQTELFVLG